MLLEVSEALGESDDVVDHVRGEIGHVRQSRENVALSRPSSLDLWCFRGAAVMGGGQH